MTRRENLLLRLWRKWRRQKRPEKPVRLQIPRVAVKPPHKEAPGIEPLEGRIAPATLIDASTLIGAFKAGRTQLALDPTLNEQSFRLNESDADDVFVREVPISIS